MKSLQKTFLKLRIRARNGFKAFQAFALKYFFKFRGTDQTFMIPIAIIIGLAGGFGAVAIQNLIKFFKRLFWGHWDVSVDYLMTLSWQQKIIVPVIGSIIVGLIVHFFSKEAKGHGVPEVMEAIALQGGKIRPRVVVSKLLASSVYIGAGGSVGREGPVIQIGSAIGSAVGQFLKVSPRRMKTFVACGAASGIAAAFNAPIAGALFSLEIILGDFAVSQFSPIVISSVMATVVSRHYLGDHSAFSVPEYNLVSPLELIPYAILGVVAGLVALSFIKVLYRFEDFFDELKVNQVIKTTAGGLLIGLMGIFIPGIFGVGYDSMDAALLGNLSWMMMLMLVFAKVLATSISLGSGGSGGIFAPSLFLGTMTGGFFGALVHQYFPEFTASSGAYSLVGMGALVGGATHAPITAILIIFEMTNDYNIILPLMVSTIIATIFTRKMQKESIYTLKLLRKGINLFAGRDVNILRNFKVADIMRHTYPVMYQTTPLKDILVKMLDEKSNEFFIINKKGKLLGSITMNAIKEFLNDQDVLADIVIASDIVDEYGTTLKDTDSLDLVMHQFGRKDTRFLPVIDSEEYKILLGVVYIQDAIDTYNKELFKRDLTGGFDSVMTGMERGRTIEIVDKYKLMEIEVPEDYVGKKIKDIDIRKKYNIEIILIRKNIHSPEGLKQRSGAIPNANYKFIAGDDILVLGEDQDIDRFQKRNPKT